MTPSMNIKKYLEELNSCFERFINTRSISDFIKLNSKVSQLSWNETGCQIVSYPFPYRDYRYNDFDPSFSKQIKLLKEVIKKKNILNRESDELYRNNKLSNANTELQKELDFICDWLHAELVKNCNYQFMDGKYVLFREGIHNDAILYLCEDLILKIYNQICQNVKKNLKKKKTRKITKIEKLSNRGLQVKEFVEDFKKKNKNYISGIDYKSHIYPHPLHKHWEFFIASKLDKEGYDVGKDNYGAVGEKKVSQIILQLSRK